MIPIEFEQRLHQLVDVFLKENAVINLSAFRTEEACWTGNVLDSLSALDLEFFKDRSSHEHVHDLSSSESPSSPNPFSLREKGRILDLGTGGGFPLLPLAICLPHASFTGLDATAKKIAAVERIVQALEIPNVTLVTGRAEELGRDKAHREQYDIVLVRGVAAINVLLEYASPFVKKGGKAVFWKSMTIEEELKDSLLARAELSCHLIAQHAYELPENWGKRQLLIFEKASNLSGKYPRAVGVPKKNPLA